SAVDKRWHLRAMGALELLPAETVAVLKQAEELTRDRSGATVNLAVGYGGRREIADAVRSLLAEHAERGTPLDELVELLDVEHISEHLYTRGQPDPDLIIRTSGEQRLSGFLLWQTAHSEFYFTDVYWPDVRLEYVRLGLRFDRLESGFVDAYTGDPRVRAEVLDEPAPTPQQVRDQARGLLRELDSAGLSDERTAYLRGQLTGLECTARKMSDEPVGFVEEVAAYFQV